MSQCRTVIFDMDGVLFDTEKLCMDVWGMVAAQDGIPDMEQVVLRCIGRNANDTRQVVMEHYGEDFPYDHFRERVSRRTAEILEKEGTPVKYGVRELLSYLESAGYRIGLASSSRRETVENHLERTGLLSYFSALITGDMVEHSKPLPDIYLLACRAMGAEPEDAYAIEDSPNGIRSAHAAGMKPIMVPDLIPADEELRSLSYRVFKDLLEVRDFLRDGTEA